MGERIDPQGIEINEMAAGLGVGCEYVVQENERWLVSKVLGLAPNQVGGQLIGLANFSLRAGDTLVYKGRIGDLGFQSEEDPDYPLFKAGSEITSRVPELALVSNFVAPDLKTCQKLRAKNA